MLVRMKNLLMKAEQSNYAIGGFNCPGLEYAMAVVRGAEESGKPVALSFPQVHERTVPLRVIGPILLRMAEEASVPMCVHLDHGSSIDYIHEALDLGFNSVMYDGSPLNLEENIQMTRAVVELAQQYNADVEAELGGIAGDESGISTPEKTKGMLTDPDEAVRFVKETGINTLAASIGTSHGFYTASPKIDFARIEEIHQRTGIPLVMHGGSGVSEKDYGIAISKGIRKINYYSYMAKAGVDGVTSLLKQKEVKYFHEMSNAAEAAMEKDVRLAINLFNPG